jgi:hypothetical protein
MAWNYNAKDYNSNSFELIPEGKYRVRIEKTEEKQSRTGKDMIKLELKVSGHFARLFHYVVLDPTNPQMTNQRLGEFFNSFDITPGDMNCYRWIGKVGAAKVRHGEYNGETQASVSYFMPRSKQEELPPWQERASSSAPSSAPPSYPDMSSMRDNPAFREPEASEMSDCPF